MKIKTIDSSCSRRDLRVVQVRGAAVREFQGRWWEGRHCGGKEECAQSVGYDRECIEIDVCEVRDLKSREHEAKERDHRHAVLMVFPKQEVWDCNNGISSRLS